MNKEISLLDKEDAYEFVSDISYQINLEPLDWWTIDKDIIAIKYDYDFASDSLNVCKDCFFVHNINTILVNKNSFYN